MKDLTSNSKNVNKSVNIRVGEGERGNKSGVEKGKKSVVQMAPELGFNELGGEPSLRDKAKLKRCALPAPSPRPPAWLPCSAPPPGLPERPPPPAPPQDDDRGKAQGCGEAAEGA